MAIESPIKCSVITPERAVLETTATSIVYPQHDGSAGILKGRAPLVCELGIGILKIETTDQGMKEFFVDGGFAQVRNNDVSILTQRAVPAEQITRAEAEKALATAEAMKITDEASFQARQDALQRARVQLQMAKK